MKKISKKQMVEKHLIKHNSITSVEAILEYWCTRLSAVIHSLKADGWVFKTTLVPHTSGSYYAKYELISLPPTYYDNI